eukprot:NODE_57_length_25931_cov_0.351037.p16 type:complete len:127 gc:universal NODE_57_length_25931_cov_0.351037:16776-16396(-)
MLFGNVWRVFITLSVALGLKVTGNSFFPTATLPFTFSSSFLLNGGVVGDLDLLLFCRVPTFVSVSGRITTFPKSLVELAGMLFISPLFLRALLIFFSCLKLVVFKIPITEEGLPKHIGTFSISTAL